MHPLDKLSRPKLGETPDLMWKIIRPGRGLSKGTELATEPRPLVGVTGDGGNDYGFMLGHEGDLV